jgi:hypothetical protein
LQGMRPGSTTENQNLRDNQWNGNKTCIIIWKQIMATIMGWAICDLCRLLAFRDYGEFRLLHAHIKKPKNDIQQNSSYKIMAKCCSSITILWPKYICVLLKTFQKFGSTVKLHSLCSPAPILSDYHTFGKLQGERLLH